MRRLAVRVHLWGGLVTGPFLLVLGLSGTALVFRAEIEEAVGATTGKISVTNTAGTALSAASFSVAP
jgi:uncharacterized iron-regulated membrane protein